MNSCVKNVYYQVFFLVIGIFLLIVGTPLTILLYTEPQDQDTGVKKSKKPDNIDVTGPFLVALGALLVGATIFAMIYHRKHRKMLEKEEEKRQSFILDVQTFKRVKPAERPKYNRVIPQVFVIGSTPEPLSHSRSMESIPEFSGSTLQPQRHMGLRRHTLYPSSQLLQLPEHSMIFDL